MLTSPHPPLFFLSCPTFSFSIYGVLASLPPQGSHAELIFIFPFHNFLSPKILLNWQLFSLFPCCTSPTPPLHPLISILQLLFWISQIAPVRSSDPSPLPPTELHCTLRSLIFCLPPQSLSHARAQKPYWYFWQVRVKVFLEAGLWGCRALRGLCRLSFFSGPGRRDEAGVPFAPINNKGFVILNRTRSFVNFYFPKIDLNLFHCSSLLPYVSQGIFSQPPLLFFFFFV